MSLSYPKQISDDQKTIIGECLAKNTCGISLPMGSGKTVIALVLAFEKAKEHSSPALIIAGKTLISSWLTELNKFYPEFDDYVVLHKDYLPQIDDYKITPNIKLVFTTPEVVSKSYTSMNINDSFVYQVRGIGFAPAVTHYLDRSSPYIGAKIPGISIIHHTTWAAVFVDEVQKYTNIKTAKCQSIITIHAMARWLLSGTIINEPVYPRILGYFLLLNTPGFPRNLPDATRFIKNDSDFTGIEPTLVHRTSNTLFKTVKEPTLNKKIINVVMTPEEELVYLSMRNVASIVKTEVDRLKSIHDIRARTFSTYILTCLLYLRQILVCPMMPLASITLDFMYIQNKSHLVNIVMEEFRKLNLEDWLNDESNVCSSRMRSALKVIDSHKDERVIVFTSFRSCLDIFQTFISRRTFSLKSTQSIRAREKTLQDFEATNDGILLLTYDIGAEGLNLQASRNVLLLDPWWNSGKISQAVARVFRFGQRADSVNAYFFTSTTGLESIMYTKTDAKLDGIESLMTGNLRKHIPSFGLATIIKLLTDKTENIKWLELINKRVYDKKKPV